MPNYYRNQDDGISDPELIAVNYLIGRSAFFEIELTLAEFSDNLASLSGGNAGSPLVQTALGLESPVIIGGGNCPLLSNYLWIEKYDLPNPVRVKTAYHRFLRGENVMVYNPVSRSFNKMVQAQIVKDVPLFAATSQKGVKIDCSQSHKVIRNTADKDGIALWHTVAGTEILTFDRAHGEFSIFEDVLMEMADNGRGDVLQFSLEKEFLYVSGRNKQSGIVAHNRKPAPEI